MTCKKEKERHDVAEQISWESDQMENTLASLVTEAEVEICLFVCLFVCLLF